jgi:hypothetical protein
MSKLSEQKYFLKKLNALLTTYRLYEFSSSELLRYILREMGYDFFMTPHGLMRLKRRYI